MTKSINIPGSDWEYENLPAAVKLLCTKEEYRWMGQYNRDRLIQEATEPEPDPNE